MTTAADTVLDAPTATAAALGDLNLDAASAQPVALHRPAAASQVAAESNAAMLVRLAVERGADLDRLEQLVRMQREWEANEAKKLFTAALALFKKNAPRIFKDKHVDYPNGKGGRTAYDHATLGNVAKVIGAALADFGFSASWDPETLGSARVAVTCMLEHEAGHSRSVRLEADYDTSGGKNVIQGQGSAITYLERYTLLAITGLATEDDDDGRATAAAGAVAVVSEQILDGLLQKLEKAATDAEALGIYRAGCAAFGPTKNIEAVNEFRNRVTARRRALAAAQQEAA